MEPEGVSIVIACIRATWESGPPLPRYALVLCTTRPRPVGHHCPLTQIPKEIKAMQQGGQEKRKEKEKQGKTSWQ